MEVIMAEVRNDFSNVVRSLMDGAEGVLTSKTILGAPVRIGDQVIIPLSDVSIGCGAGSNGTDHKDKGMGAFSAKMTPSAVLIIKDGHTKVVGIKDQTAVTKLVDLIPDVIDKVRGVRSGVSNDEAIAAAFPEEGVETPAVTEQPLREAGDEN
jgi:uncharacterized spore protein YtfJ